MNPDELLALVPRAVELLPEPTPLHRLPRLSEQLGRELWIKRDDLTAVGGGGNKIRKLEYLLGEAQQISADVLVTVGAGQSNHCRTVASAAAMMGMDCHLVLGGRDPGSRSGNLLLDGLLGASVQFCGTDDWAEIFAIATAAVDELAAAGRTPYLMPAGGSTPTGALGYLRGYGELITQCQAAGISPSAVVHANGSGGTQAGLVAGRALSGSGPAIIGVAVALDAALSAAIADGLADMAIAQLDQPPAAREAAVVLDGYRGPAYGLATDAASEALALMFRTEGILLDPVYTAKAFAAIVADDDQIPDGPVVFLHTGGAPAVFAESH